MCARVHTRNDTAASSNRVICCFSNIPLHGKCNPSLKWKMCPTSAWKRERSLMPTRLFSSCFLNKSRTGSRSAFLYFFFLSFFLLRIFLHYTHFMSALCQLSDRTSYNLALPGPYPTYSTIVQFYSEAFSYSLH